MTESTPNYDAGPLALYTPSLMPPERLERLFVAREAVLTDLMRRIEVASTSTSRPHRLLVGRRGAGKTHLLSIVSHRARQLPGFGVRFLLSWLPEDPWLIDDVDDLLRLVLDKLEPTTDWDRSHDAEQALIGVAAGRPVVVLVENLDQILHDIGRSGQQRLRRLLESERSLLLLATSTQLSHDLVDESVPFHGFFDTSALEPFTVDEAREQLTAIARERGDGELSEYLASREGTARLRTVTHLAGGQPRVWSLLSGAMDVNGLDDVVSLLLPKIDELTPYYQEQLARLSPQQRKIVHVLGRENHAMSVKDLAAETSIDQRAVGRGVRELVDRGWLAEVDSPLLQYVDGRLTFYELAEPLARIVFQVKANRGEPLPVIIDFLIGWYSRSELDFALEAQPPAIADSHLRLAQTRAQHDPTATIRTLIVASLDFERQLAQDERWSDVNEYVGALRATAPPGASHAMLRFDRALAQLQRGDADGLLALPVAVRHVAEDLLAVRKTPFAARFGLQIIAPNVDHAAWLERARDLRASVPEDLGWMADVFIARRLRHLGEIETWRLLLPQLTERMRATLSSEDAISSAVNDGGT